MNNNAVEVVISTVVKVHNIFPPVEKMPYLISTYWRINDEKAFEHWIVAMTGVVDQKLVCLSEYA